MHHSCIEYILQVGVPRCVDPCTKVGFTPSTACAAARELQEAYAQKHGLPAERVAVFFCSLQDLDTALKNEGDGTLVLEQLGRGGSASLPIGLQPRGAEDPWKEAARILGKKRRQELVEEAPASTAGQ